MLAYAEYLRSDPALWRITVDYMYSCGDVGRYMGDQVLVRVPLRLKPLKDADSVGGAAARVRSAERTAGWRARGYLRDGWAVPVELLQCSACVAFTPSVIAFAPDY